jgi:hypothetical protein
LAAHSFLVRDILSELCADPLSGVFDEIVISTNLNTQDLILIVDFMVKGAITILSADSSITKTDFCLDQNLLECFKTFGICLKDLSLKKEDLDFLKFEQSGFEENDDFAEFRGPDFESEFIGLSEEDIKKSKLKRLKIVLMPSNILHYGISLQQ